MNMKKEKEIIERFGIEIVDSYSLVNNYGYKIKYNNKEYDLRHVLNVYGQDVNWWEINHITLATEEEKEILMQLEKELMKNR